METKLHHHTQPGKTSLLYSFLLFQSCLEKTFSPALFFKFSRSNLSVPSNQRGGPKNTKAAERGHMRPLSSCYDSTEEDDTFWTSWGEKGVGSFRLRFSSRQGFAEKWGSTKRGLGKGSGPIRVRPFLFVFTFFLFF